MTETPVDDSSRLREYLSVLRVRKWTVIVTALLAVLAAAFYIQRTTPTYTSTAKVLVKNPLAGLPGATNQNSAPVMQTELTIVTSTDVVACAQNYYDYATGKPLIAPSPTSSPSASASATPSHSPSGPSAGPSASGHPSPSRPSPTPSVTTSPSPTGAPAAVAPIPDQFCSTAWLANVVIRSGARQGLKVSSVAPTTVMLVSFSSHNRLNAVNWANAYANAYVEFKYLQAFATVSTLQAPFIENETSLLAQKAKIQILFGQASDNGDTLKAQEYEGELNQLSQQLLQVGQNIAALDPLLVKVYAPGVISAATLPTTPSAPKTKLIIAVGLFLGLVLGTGLAFVRERLDDSLRGRGDLEDLIGAPVLAVVPRVSGWKKRDDTHLISIEQPKASVAEVYRTLRTSVLFASAQRGMKTLMVTSATAGEGKTTTASNLAVVLADAGKRVILVSSDLRKPRIHRFFNLSNEKGLSSVLAGEVKPWEAMADPDRDHLRVLTSGPVPAHPAELLQSEQMGELIEELREVADFVILDTAPVLLVADALAIAPLADGVLLVVDSENTHRGAVIQAREQLEQVGAPLIGAVLNNFDPAKARQQYYGYYGSYWHRYRYSGYYGFNYGDDGQGPSGRRGSSTPAALPPEGKAE